MQECGYPSCSIIAENNCTACKQEWYCGRKHQQADWSRHKKECKLWKSENSHKDAQVLERVNILSLDEGTVCTITGLKNQSDLNGLKCTVRKIDSYSTGRIPVVVVCDGIEKNLLVKSENLCASQPQQYSANAQATQRQLATNTVNDVTEIKLKYNSLIVRLEEAITCRKNEQYILGEELLKELLAEVEEFCGKHSVMVATFVKSFGMLRFHQRRWSEAEDMFAHADKLRPADGEYNPQGTNTLENLFSVQLQGRLFKKASGTLDRIKSLKHCIRPGVDTNLHQLEMELATAKASPSQCMACGRLSTLLACARCHMSLYCSRSCQKTHWKIHKRDCKSTIAQEYSCNLQSQKPPVDNVSLIGMIEHVNDTDTLTSSVLCNAKATASVSPSSPTEMDAPLLAALADPQQSYFFCMNEVTSSNLLDNTGGRRRFMATAGVFSCITVFAWSKSTCANSPGPCVGAHVGLPALFRGLRACRHTKHDIDRALAPLVSQLRFCFREFTRDITVTLVGSHRAMDNSIGLVSMFPDDREKWSFAWHVKNACKAALDDMLKKVVWNSNLLMRFEGEDIENSADEERVRRKNMEFMVVALDTITGHLVTHTKYTNLDLLLTKDVMIRQYEVYKDIDPKLSIVTHDDDEKVGKM